ncbi:MAG: DUF4365 domain-containing protein [Pleomorphochaeta sp.]
MKVPSNHIQGRKGVIAVNKIFNDEFNWIFNELFNDYGIDAIVETVSEGQIDSGLLALQIKSGNSYFKVIKDSKIIFNPDFENVKDWLNLPIPVLIILCNPDGKIYWQIVNKTTVLKLGKTCKIEIPLSNTLTINNKNIINDFCKLKLSTPSYDELSIGDISHNLAKRYSANIILNKDLSKSEIHQLILLITDSYKKRKYYRSNLVKDRWSDSEASVVSLFIYKSVLDSKHSLWLCRSQWISEKLNQDSAPTKIKGDHLSNDLIVDWNDNYNQIAQLYAKPLLKEDYLPKCLNILELGENYLTNITKLFYKYKNDEITENKFSKQISKFNIKIEELYKLTREIENPTLECIDTNNCLNYFVISIDNIRIEVERTQKESLPISNRNWLIDSHIKRAKKYHGELKYELEKITN